MDMLHIFKNATNGTFRLLGDSLRQNPHFLMTRESEQAVDNVLNHQAAYLGVLTSKH